MQKIKPFIIYGLLFAILILLPCISLADIGRSSIRYTEPQQPYYFIEMWVNFFLTIIIEASVVLVLFKTIFKKQDVSDKRLFLASIVPSIITFPIFYLFYYLLFPPQILADVLSMPSRISSEWVFKIVAEVAIFIIETFILSYILNISKKQAAVVSLVANLASFVIGSFVSVIIVNFIGPYLN